MKQQTPQYLRIVFGNQKVLSTKVPSQSDIHRTLFTAAKKQQGKGPAEDSLENVSETFEYVYE